jgi:hypothetical protein
VADSYSEAADKAAELESELQNLIDTIDEVNGLNQDVASANSSYQSALADIADEVLRQKDAYEELNGTVEGFKPTLDDSTASGAANVAMLADVAGKAQEAARQQLELDVATGDSEGAAKTYLGTLEAQRKAFIDSAEQAGFSAREVQKLADKFFALPDEQTVDVLVDTLAAQTSIDNFIYANNGKTITLKTAVVGRRSTVGNDGGPGGFADGGEIPGRPSRTDNVLIHAASGEFVVNTEAAQRNKALLHFLNSGGRIRGYASGGEVQPRYAASVPRSSSSQAAGGAIAINQVIQPAPGMSEEQIARIAAEKTTFALRRF